MNLAETLLPKLAEWRPAGAGPHTVDFDLPDHGWMVHVTADRAESLGCLLTEIGIVRSATVPDDAAALKAYAGRAAARVTGLREPLRIVEVDETRIIALLRSNAPAVKGDDVSYYEVTLHGRNRITVQRFAASRVGTAQRQAIAFALTHEIIAKLVEDLTSD